jgi:hypothetical protein
MALTDTEVKKASPREKDYKLSDAGGCAGLFVLVKTNGSKYWRLKYRIAGKEKLMQIGVYPTVSLKDARLKAFEAKRLIDDGVDPMAQRKAEKREALGASENTFEVIANAWLGLLLRTRSSVACASAWLVNSRAISCTFSILRCHSVITSVWIVKTAWCAVAGACGKVFVFIV